MALKDRYLPFYRSVIVNSIRPSGDVTTSSRLDKRSESIRTVRDPTNDPRSDALLFPHRARPPYRSNPLRFDKEKKTKQRNLQLK